MEGGEEKKGKGRFGIVGMFGSEAAKGGRLSVGIMVGRDGRFGMVGIVGKGGTFP